MKRIVFDGLVFIRDDKTGYYLNSKTHKRLHRYVWEKHNGKIPEGYDIHHIDGNKSNNDISNLQIMTKSEHIKLHWKNEVFRNSHNELELTEERKEQLRIRMQSIVRPKADIWHGSKCGIEWHKKHYEEMKDQLHEKKEFVCKNCGKPFMSVRYGFCCNACKSAYRRKMGYDNETRNCVYCGKEFTVNKYSKATHCSKKCTMMDRQKRLIQYNGTTKSVSNWSRDTGIKADTIIHRLNMGWSAEKALTTPTRKYKNESTP